MDLQVLFSVRDPFSLAQGEAPDSACLPPHFWPWSNAKKRLHLGIILFTNNLGRARHSVRAAVCKSTRSAGRGLPALPILTHLFVIWIIPSIHTQDRHAFGPAENPMHILFPAGGASPAVDDAIRAVWGINPTSGDATQRQRSAVLISRLGKGAVLDASEPPRTYPGPFRTCPGPFRTCPGPFRTRPEPFRMHPEPFR